MEEEMQKWKRKDLPAIRRSMANPGQNLFLLNVKGLLPNQAMSHQQLLVSLV